MFDSNKKISFSNIKCQSMLLTYVFAIGLEQLALLLEADTSFVARTAFMDFKVKVLVVSEEKALFLSCFRQCAR